MAATGTPSDANDLRYSTTYSTQASMNCVCRLLVTESFIHWGGDHTLPNRVMFGDTPSIRCSHVIMRVPGLSAWVGARARSGQNESSAVVERKLSGDGTP